jgi:hypothetical protein
VPPTRRSRRRAAILVASLIGTFAVLRVALGFSPDSDFDVAGYNIHHLFTGVLVMTAGAVPLVVAPSASRWGDLATAVFGVGLSMVLDEWVYLIATDGSNASYLLPVSFWGGVVVVGLAVVYTVVVAVLVRDR